MASSIWVCHWSKQFLGSSNWRCFGWLGLLINGVVANHADPNLIFQKSSLSLTGMCTNSRYQASRLRLHFLLCADLLRQLRMTQKGKLTSTLKFAANKLDILLLPGPARAAALLCLAQPWT